MMKAIFSLAASLAFASAALGQIPQQYIWKITFISDDVGTSRISVQNRCRDTHEFSISGRNVPYLEFEKSKVTVRGGKSENVNVTVDTHNLDRRSYLGEVTLFCLTCARESGCSQSRDILNVTLNVVTQDQLTNYKPSKEFGIDAPIAITSSARSSGSGNTSFAEAEALLLSLSGNPDATAGPRSVSSCGVPQFKGKNSSASKDCKNCSQWQKAVRELEEKVRRETELAEKYCLGLMQLENTTAFVEARASRAERQLSDASKGGSDERVLESLRTEAENSKKDARVFRDKLETARQVVDEAKARAFAAMQELDEAGNSLDKCVKQNPVCK